MCLQNIELEILDTFRQLSYENKNDILKWIATELMKQGENRNIRGEI